MQFTFDAELYPWTPKKSDGGEASSWIFVSLPQDVSDAVDDATSMTGGFGSVKVNVQLGGSNWSTSLFPSKELATYVLPVKKAIRSAESVEAGDLASFTIELVHV